jgi:hypothetical protein
VVKAFFKVEFFGQPLVVQAAFDLPVVQGQQVSGQFRYGVSVLVFVP